MLQTAHKLDKEGRNTAAQALYLKSIEACKNASNRKGELESTVELGRSYVRADQYDKALHVLSPIVKECEQVLGPTHAEYGSCLEGMSRALRYSHNIVEAKKYANEVVLYEERKHGVTHPRYLPALLRLARICMDGKAYKDAAVYYSKAANISAETSGKNSEERLLILRELKHSYKLSNNLAAADSIDAQIVAIEKVQLANSKKHPGETAPVVGEAILKAISGTKEK